MTETTGPIKDWPADVPEVWKPVPGHEHYEASSFGRVRSLDYVHEFHGRWGPIKYRRRGRILKHKRKTSGYHFIGVNDRVYLHVSRVVCAAFHGEPPSESHEAAHHDGDKDNNRPDNLSWKTPVENDADKIRHGTRMIGTRNPQARLSPPDVESIFFMFCSGTSTADLVARFSVTQSQIAAILRRKSWPHVPIHSGIVALARELSQRHILEASQRTNRRRQERAHHAV